MKINLTIEDEYIEGLVQEGCEKIAVDYIQRSISNNVRFFVEKEIKDRVNTIIKEQVDDSEDLQKLIRNELYANYCIVLDRVIINMKQKSSYHGTNKAEGEAIREVIYSEKEKIIEEVIKRASAEVAKKANVRLVKQLMGEMV